MGNKLVIYGLHIWSSRRGEHCKIPKSISINASIHLQLLSKNLGKHKIKAVFNIYFPQCFYDHNFSFILVVALIGGLFLCIVYLELMKICVKQRVANLKRLEWILLKYINAIVKQKLLHSARNVVFKNHAKTVLYFLISTIKK